jgi:daunorubicin resistance ABC transporter membrane protein
MTTPTRATQPTVSEATQSAAQSGAAGDAAVVDRIRVSVPDRGFRHDLRAVGIVWRRELIRFRTDRLRAITALVQPFLFLFILGTGLSNLAGGSLPHTASFDFKTFIYPGVLAMSVLFTAIFSAGSIVWDREFGFLREILVAPVSRAAIVLGKCLGGATIATFQGVIFLCLAWFAHVPYNPVLILGLIGMLLLLSFTLTAFGVMMAARIKQFQAFMALTQMLVLPLFFLSGALYPLTGLPTWLTVLTRLDPLTYIVGPMRHLVFSHLNVSPQVAALINTHLAPSITWGGWVVPLWLSLGIVAAMGAGMTAVAIAEFSKTE